MKKGYTLIEVIAVLGIIMILMIPAIGLSKAYKKNVSRIKAKSVISEVANLISYSKYYCRFNDSNGVIEVNSSTGGIDFRETTSIHSVLKTVIIPKEITVVNKFSLQVSKSGSVKSDSIRIKDDVGNIYIITISTGVDTVNIYEGDN